MISGDQDEIAPDHAILKLVSRLNSQKGVMVDHRVFGGADHVFAKQSDAVAAAVTDYVGGAQTGNRPSALAA